ncbi:MAG: T9SS type A sorting domain-containing protein [Candidatus Kapabacteria bacterium]|nr:T9SS type A sorting domain-containing protein [Candidatus Kapabacteria bacterium]
MVNARTTDGGYNWFIQTADTQKVVYNDKGQVVEVIGTKYKGARCLDYVTPDFAVIGHIEGQITISRDGGDSWDSLSLNTIQDIKIIRFADSLSGIALTNNFIFLTTDGGVTWENITSNLNYSGAIYFQSAFMRDDFIYAGGFFSLDKGNTWTKSNPILNINGMHGVNFINNYEGWCSGRRQIVPNQFQYVDVILHTTNSGLDWVTQLDTVLEPHFPLTGDIYFANSSEGLAYGEGGKIWRTSDGGQYWDLDKSFPIEQSDHFTKLAFPNGNLNKILANVYFIGDIWMFTDPTSIEENVIGTNDMSIFPNPASEYITITKPSEGFEPSEVSGVQIFNTLGECVLKESIHPMTPSHRMNVEHLPSGVYYLRIGSRTQMFVKM